MSSLKKYEKVIISIGGTVLMVAFILFIVRKKVNEIEYKKAKINEVIKDREMIEGRFFRYTFNGGNVYVQFYPDSDPLMIGDSIVKDSGSSILNVFRKQQGQYQFEKKCEW